MLLTLAAEPKRRRNHATNTTNTTRNRTRTANTFMINQRLEDMLFRYFSSWACAESTFAKESSMFSSMRMASSPCSCTCRPCHIMPPTSTETTHDPRQVDIWYANWKCTCHQHALTMTAS